MADNNALRHIVLEPSPKSKSGLKKIGIRVNGTKKSLKPNVAEAAAPQMPSVMPDVPSTTAVPKGIPKIVKSAKTDVIQSVLPAAEVLEVKEDTPPVKKKAASLKPIGQSVAAAVESDGKENDPYMPELPLPRYDELNENDLLSAMPIAAASNRVKEDPCPQLYDPCTREPIASIDVLEKRIKEIKNQDTYETSPIKKLDSSIRTRLDLLLFILNRPESPNEGLLEYTENGQLYEAYWDIVFALGRIDSFPITDDFYMYNGKIETLTSIDEPTFMNIPLTYLQSKKVNEGAKSGASDITFVYKAQKDNLDIDPCSAEPTIKVTDSCRKVKKDEHKEQDKPLFYFCSSKYFKNDKQKGVDKYDIQNIYTAAKNLNTEYDRKIILLVKDKAAVKEKMRRAIRKYLSEEAYHIYGMTELFTALQSLYDLIHSKHSGQITKEVLIKLLHLESKPLPIMHLRLHQYIATYKICDAIKQFSRGQSNKFLVGIVPRGGKTYIAGGIIDQLQPKRVVVLLGAKSETLSQFKKDLFESFQNFREYECIDVVDKAVKDEEINPAKRYIFIMSIELYKTESNTRPILKELKDGKLRADLFICDEAHLKQTTRTAVIQMAKGTMQKEVEEEKEITDAEETTELKEIDVQILPDVPVVYMTGTYIKPLTAFKIPKEHVIIWDYQDIQEAKKITTNEEYFTYNFGEYYDRALQTCIAHGQTHEIIEQQYQKFPELYLLTTQFTPRAKDAFLKQSSKGFPTISHLFEVRPDFNPTLMSIEQWHTGFTNPKGIQRLLNYLAPSSAHLPTDSNGQPVEPIESALTSIDHIAQRIGDRLRFFTTDFVAHSQLWFLPQMQGHPLGKRMCALAGAIFQLPWFRKHFHVIAVSSSVDWNIPGAKDNRIQIRAADGSDSCGTFTWACPTNGQSLKQCLINEEIKARQEGKGLIILAQNMLHLGISLPCVDIVVLLDTGEKVDERIQKMYRALTESTNKKGGFIIDMNYFRTVTAIMNYQITGEESRTGKKVYASDVPKIFNRILDVFSIDDDKPIFGTHEQRAKGESIIQKETIPELQRLLERTSKDGIQLTTVASALDKNIEDVLRKTYSGTYAEFLGMLKEEAAKKSIRTLNSNVPPAAKHESNNKSDNESESNDDEPIPIPPIFPPTQKTEEQKRKTYIEIFKTILTFGAFGTNALELSTLETKLATDLELRETLYDTLIKRGLIIDIRTEEQRNFIIDILIRPNLQKIISEGRNTSYMKMKEHINDNAHYPESVQKVLEYIVEHLAPKTAERHKFGEVFTPMTLVHEMLDTLPVAVWNNKDLKWLDPANGMGNYPIATFLRLFYGFRTKDGKYVGITESGDGKYNPGLTRVIKNEDARRKHIVEKMLFMVELNPKNNAIARRLFMKLAPGVEEPNIIQLHKIEGFLADVAMKFPNGTVNEFDIIMGNPPFQGGAVKGKTTSKTRKMRIEENVGQDKHKNLWIPFVKKVLAKHMKKNGYLLFIHPIGWFKPDRTGIHEEMLQYQIKDMRIYDMYQSMKVFSGKGKISVAYYLLENKPVYTTTTIVDRVGKKEIVQLNSKSIIILAINSIFSKIQKKASLFYDDDQLRVTSIPSAKCSAGSNKQIHRISETGEITYCKTSVKHKDQHSPKLYLSGYQNPRFYHDKDGIYGLIGSHQHYFIGSDLDKLEDYFKTKLSAILLKHAKYDQEFIEPKYYPDVRTLPLKKITDDTLADYFGFTKEERAAINATEYPKRHYKFKEITCAQVKGEKEPKLGGFLNKTRKNRK